MDSAHLLDQEFMPLVSWPQWVLRFGYSVTEIDAKRYCLKAYMNLRWET